MSDARLPDDPFSSGHELDDGMALAAVLWEGLWDATIHRGFPGLADALGSLDENELRWILYRRVVDDLEAIVRKRRDREERER